MIFVENTPEFWEKFAERTAEIVKRKNANNPLKKRLSDINFSVRAQNIFRDNDLETVEDLILTGSKGLMEMRNFGKTTLMEVEYKLKELNLKIN